MIPVRLGKSRVIGAGRGFGKNRCDFSKLFLEECKVPDEFFASASLAGKSVLLVERIDGGIGFVSGYRKSLRRNRVETENTLSSEKWGLVSGLAGDDFQGDDPPSDFHGDGRGVGVLPGPRSEVRSSGSWNYCVRG
jgi:hypothetical protein